VGDRSIRRISVIAPMLNEAEHVDGLAGDIAAQDWDGELEVLVADGGSSDGSVARLRAAAARAGLDVVVLENPERSVSHALNRCIRAASGDLIIRVDCHSRYPSDYVRRCALAAEETGAENVGGMLVPVGRTLMERAVAAALDSAFGGIGWTRHQTDERREVDTVTFGAYRREVFDRAGLFDEELVRNQDDEFNLRLRRAGGRVVLDPSIRVYYTPRGDFRRLFRQYYEYGRWKAPVMRKHGRPTSARSLAPGAFVLGLAALIPLSAWHPHAAALLALKVSAYVALAVGFGIAGLRRRREPWTLLPRIIAVFPTMHLAHGIGMIAGWLRSAGRRSSAVAGNALGSIL
jgi:succinoglycan biosynthesis protein ExoA